MDLRKNSSCPNVDRFTREYVCFLLGDYGPVTVQTPIGSSATQCMELGVVSECDTNHTALADYLCLSESIVVVRFEAISEPTELSVQTMTGKTVVVALHQNATIQKS